MKLKRKHTFSRFKLSDATQSDALVGLAITDTTAIDGVTDGIFFTKDDGDTNLDFVVEKDQQKLKQLVYIQWLMILL